MEGLHRDDLGETMLVNIFLAELGYILPEIQVIQDPSWIKLSLRVPCVL